MSSWAPEYAGQTKRRSPKLTLDSTTGAERVSPHRQPSKGNPVANTSLQTAIDPFFWEELSPAAQRVVEREACRIFDELAAHAAWAPLNCDLAANRWLAAFRAAGIAAELRSGNYNPAFDRRAEHPLSSDHVWLRVEGKLFDPTAGQFAGSGPIQAQFYFDSSEME